jgi:phage gpG-like protein
MVGGFAISYRVKDGTGDELALHKMAAAFEYTAADFARMGEFLYPELIPVFESALADQFLAEGKGPNRGKWAALTEKYAKAKRKKHGVRPILVASGDLMRGLTDSNSSHAQRVYNAKQFSFGTSEVPYASFHQTGTKSKSGGQKMVDRPLFDFATTFSDAVNITGRRVARKVARERLDTFVTVAGGP